ncbi:MAG: Mpo1 family 2-hydroxy fatty acid dioxygenase [Thermoanaerobaculia bacterium]
MPDVNALFADYASYHRTAGNKWFHRFGIPMIVLSLMGMLTRVEIFSIDSFRIDLAMVLILASAVYYLALEWRLGLAMLGVSIIFYVAGAALPFSVNLALFILGWIFQFVGHSLYEKNRPAFAKNLVHLLIGPLWILSGMVPRRKTPRAPVTDH